MKLLECIIVCVCCAGCNCHGSEYTKVPTFANMMCPADQIKFQKVTHNAIDCVRNCIAAPGCTSLIYLHDNKTCLGIKSYNPFNESSPLQGSVYYKPKIVAPGTPMVEELPDSQFTASSSWSTEREPWHARFNSTKAWVPATMDTNQWLQVDFTQQIVATHVVTKGWPYCCDWVTSYKVLTSTDCTNFGTIKDDIGNDKVFLGHMDPYSTDTNSREPPVVVTASGVTRILVFPGNTDFDTAAQNAIEPPGTCRCIRINPLTWMIDYAIALRLEVLGHIL